MKKKLIRYSYIILVVLELFVVCCIIFLCPFMIQSMINNINMMKLSAFILIVLFIILFLQYYIEVLREIKEDNRNDRQKH